MACEYEPIGYTPPAGGRGGVMEELASECEALDKGKAKLAVKPDNEKWKK